MERSTPHLMFNCFCVVKYGNKQKKALTTKFYKCIK